MKTISQTLINLMLETGLAAFIVPVGVITAWKIHIKKKIAKPFWTGILTYIIFAVIVKYAVDLIFAGDNVIGNALSSNGTALAVYNAFVGALILVFGTKFMYYRTMNSFQDKQYSVSFGIGFAGAGVICRMGIPLIFYNFVANYYNFELTHKNGRSDAEIAKIISKQDISFIRDIKWSTVSTLSISSFIAFILEAAAAVLVFSSIRKKLVEQGHITEKHIDKGSVYGRLKSNVVFWYCALLSFIALIPLYIVTGRKFTDLHVLVAAEVIEAVVTGFVAFFAKMVYDSLGAAGEEDGKNSSKEKAGHITKMANMKLSRIKVEEPDDERTADHKSAGSTDQSGKETENRSGMK